MGLDQTLSYESPVIARRNTNTDNSNTPNIDTAEAISNSGEIASGGDSDMLQELTPQNPPRNDKRGETVQKLLTNLSSNRPFERAIGTRYLGEKVGQILGIDPYLQEKATSHHLTEGKSPRILLIATHGYCEKPTQVKDYIKVINQLLIDPTNSESILNNKKHLLTGDFRQYLQLVINYLAKEQRKDESRFLEGILNQINAKFPQKESSKTTLRSGFALAGANLYVLGKKIPEEAGKGLFFAEDIAVLDLWQNDLTVLSACETGLGDVKLGEGVFGLRRAFAVAGNKTLVMSLWSVPDKASALLMDRFFAYHKAGDNYQQALQKAQNYLRYATVEELKASELGKEVLEELEKAANLIPQSSSICQAISENNFYPLSHPFFWGAWICQGDQ